MADNNQTLSQSLNTDMNRGRSAFSTAAEPFEKGVSEALKARGELEAAKESMLAQSNVTKAKGELEASERFAEDVKKLPVRASMKEVVEKTATPFIPTQDNAQSLAAIFMLTNIAGFAMGAGGKRNAQAAMSAMNGMLEGYQKGRKDLYKKEKDIFDANMKQLKMRYDFLDREYQDSLQLLKTDKDAAFAKLNVAFAQTGADFLKENLERRGIARGYEAAKEARDSFYRAWREVGLEQDRARAQAFREEQERTRAAERDRAQTFREEQARISAELRREQIAMSRERLKEQRLARAERESKLGPTEKKEVRGFERLQDEVALLKATFKPEYANFIADAAGDVVAKAKERLQNDPAMAEWWRRYENVALPERHAMFGATLTGKEQQSWRKASVGPGNSSQQIQNWMADKERTLERNLKQYDRPSSPAAGAGAGSQNVENQARASFGSYEPDKYEYGVNPATGKFARRKKE